VSINTAIADVLSANDRASMHLAVAAMLRLLPNTQPSASASSVSVAALHAEIERLEKICATAQAEVRALDADNHKLICRNIELFNEAERLRDEIAASAARNEALEAEAENLSSEMAKMAAALERAKAAAPLPAVAPAQDNIKDEPIPADDETPNPVRELVKRARTIQVGEFEIITAPTIVATIAALQERDRSVAEMIELNLAPNREAMNRLMSKVVAALKEQTKGEWEVINYGSTYAGGVKGRLPGAYRLQKSGSNADEMPLPEYRPTAQSEGVDGSSPEQGAAESQSGSGAGASCEAVQFVTPPVEGEGVVVPADPLPAADDEPEISAPTIEPVKVSAPLHVQPPPILPSDPAFMKAAVVEPEPSNQIAPGHVIGVDIKRGTVHTAKGSYSVQGTTGMARVLDVMKTGEMFGLSYLAQKGGWKDTTRARNELLMEAGRLNRHGITLYCDKVNARLRVA
jgi:hypothetical protein